MGFALLLGESPVDSGRISRPGRENPAVGNSVFMAHILGNHFDKHCLSVSSSMFVLGRPILMNGEN